jgi:hypothetical protein
MKNTPVSPRLGSRQDSRFLAHLNPDTVKVDERSLEDLLLFTAQFSQLINFYNLENKIDGNWSNFFNDELVVLANIHQTNPNEIEQNFQQTVTLINRFKRPEKKKYYLEKAFAQIFEVAMLFEKWSQQLREVELFSGVSAPLRNEIFNAIDNRLGQAFVNFQNLYIEIQQNENLQLSAPLEFQYFSPFWTLGEYEQALLKPDAEATDLPTFYVSALEDVFKVFYETLIYLKNQAGHYFQESLKQDTHYPEISLLVAFLQLYETQQKHLNEVSQRYLDFYYYEVLKQTHKPLKANQLYVKFNLNDNALIVTVEKEERLIAGEYESGDDIIYTTDDKVQLNKIEVTKLHTIYADFQTLNVRGLPLRLMSSMISADIPTEEVTPNPEKIVAYNFPTFGEKRGLSNMSNYQPQESELGFAVASHGLFLSEGTREINVILAFNKSTFDFLVELVTDLSITFNETTEEIFIKVFLEAFRLEITTPEEWLSITKYVAVRNENEATLTISFTVDAVQPPVVAYNPEVHGGGYQTNLPILKIILNGDSYLYPYTLLEKLVVEQVTIQTDVSGVRDLKLYSEFGELSAATPFLPFGPSPHLGSYFILGKNEVFQKSLDKLSLRLEWFNLPKDKSGFFGYYLPYELPLDNACFEVNLSILNEGRWIPENSETRQKLKLFRTKHNPEATEPQPESELHPIAKFDNIDISNLRLSHNYADITKETNYTNLSDRGFIKLEFASPDFGFGQEFYATTVSRIVMENTQKGIISFVRNGFRKQEQQPMPNQPYAPQLQNITLNYSSTSVILLSDRSVKPDKINERGQFFHIHPFGEQQVYPNSRQHTTKLLPEFYGEGCLLLGLQDVNPPQMLSILFELTEGVGSSSDEARPQIEWSYLVDDEWKILPPNKILGDGTDNFIKTGVVILELPFDFKNGNTILDKELFWLRATAISNIGVVGRLKNVCTQVVSSTWEVHEAYTEFLETPLPAFSLRGSESNILGIKDLQQPLSAYGGRPEETSKQFVTRISERLRHKQRAINPFDFERLVLERFSQVYQATCLPNMTSKSLYSPSSVMLVVSPLSDSQHQEPQVSSELLYEIKQYLQSFASPFTNLEVRNPAYERVKIIADVQLALGYGFGYYAQKLNDDINAFLASSIAGKRKAGELGGRINTADVVSHILALPYVEFITRFSMVQVAEDFRGNSIILDTATGTWEKREINKDEFEYVPVENGTPRAFLQATKPWAVLVPAEKHQLVATNEKKEVIATKAGVGNLQVSIDLVVE